MGRDYKKRGFSGAELGLDPPTSRGAIFLLVCPDPLRCFTQTTVPFLPLMPRWGQILQEHAQEATAIDNRQGHTVEGHMAQPEVEWWRWELAFASSAVFSPRKMATQILGELSRTL